MKENGNIPPCAHPSLLATTGGRRTVQGAKPTPPSVPASPTSPRAAARRRHYRANLAGRDFVVGDLHGCKALLLQLLSHVGFDTRVDRLFSVGDLVDRGPDSLGCLRLLNDRWIHSVRGNHEQMMIDWLASEDDGGHWFANGGDWVLEHRDGDARKEIEALGRRLAELPLMATVTLRDGTRFHVVHAEFPAGAVRSEADLADPLRVGRLLEATTRWGERSVLWGRDLLEPAGFQALTPATIERVRRGAAAFAPTPADASMARIYCGHTVVRSPLRVGSLVGIDTGAFLVGRGRNAGWAGLTLTEPLTDRFWTATTEGVREACAVSV